MLLVFGISIHAPLAGSDPRRRPTHIVPCNFNPRSPCGERHSTRTYVRIHDVFQSTLPLRGATFSRAFNGNGGFDFNPRSPCGERPMERSRSVPFRLFQSTLPLRGATRHRPSPPGRRQISIHAPLAGSDVWILKRTESLWRFQSTLPLRGATKCHDKTRMSRKISIHAPLAGSDSRWTLSQRADIDFNPRSPCGERPVALAFLVQEALFQSTLPLRGATPSRPKRPHGS